LSSDNHSMNPDARFWNRVSKRYSNKPVSDQEAYEAKLNTTDSHLQVTDRVLEVGCGTGTTAIHHASKVYQFFATDFAPRMIDIARAKAEKEGITNVHFRVAEVDQLPHDEEPFDMILAHNVLQLVEKPARVIARLGEALKPGGLFVTTTPCIGDLFALLKVIAPVGRALRLMPRISVFRESDLTQWLDEAGFDLEHRWLPGEKSGVFMIARRRSPITSE